MYAAFRAALAADFNRLTLPYNAYIRGKGVVSSDKIMVPVTPIHFEKKKSGCNVTGAMFCTYDVQGL